MSKIEKLKLTVKMGMGPRDTRVYTRIKGVTYELPVKSVSITSSVDQLTQATIVLFIGKVEMVLKTEMDDKTREIITTITENKNEG
jgi:hypothetical protein